MLAAVLGSALGYVLPTRPPVLTSTPLQYRVMAPLIMAESFSDGLGTYDDAPATVQSAALAEKKKDLEACAQEVIAAAGPFGDKVTDYAKSWTKKLLESGSAGAEKDFVLIEECLLDSDECEAFEAAVKKMQTLAGSDWAGTAC